MNTVAAENSAPQNSIILEKFGNYHYLDTYKVSVENIKELSVDYVIARFFSSGPSWGEPLMNIRNALVKAFGLKTGRADFENSVDENIHYEKGSKISFFTVHSRNENEIVLYENDRHLNFRTSVFVNRSNKEGEAEIYSTTVVKFNNIWGRLYFTPVKPFHRAIVKTSLRNLAKSFTK